MWDRDAEIVRNWQVAHNIHLMGLKAPEIAKGARPGQFVMIRVADGLDPLLRRPFSICGTEGDHILVLYRVVGVGTRILSEAREGESVDVLGPLGHGFDYHDTVRRAVLTAGGMGVAPLLFLARSLPPEKWVFLAGFGSVDQVIRVDQAGLFDMPISIATEDGSGGRKGLITDLLEDTLKGEDAAETRVFACGPLPMLRAVAAIARGRGIPCQVSLEAQMACGLGACQGCAVKAAPETGRTYRHVCQDGPVFDAMSLDWEAME